MTSGRSLLTFVDVPVVVGDPDGSAVYANPAFERLFPVGDGPLLGTPLASLFEGGAREALLNAVAECCERGESLRFRVRERGVGFTALASPIAEGGQRYGVILILLEEALAEERLLAYQREIQEPLAELSTTLEEIFEQTGGRRSAHLRDRVEQALRAVDHLRKWTEALHDDAAGASRRGRDGVFDVVRAIRNAAGGLASGEEAHVELLLPAELPTVRGDGARFEAALVSLLRDRIERSAADLSLSAKVVGRGERAGVLVSLTEAADGDPEEAPAASDVVLDVLTATGATIRTTCEPGLGRTTSIRLSLGD